MGEAQSGDWDRRPLVTNFRTIMEIMTGIKVQSIRRTNSFSTAAYSSCAAGRQSKTASSAGRVESADSRAVLVAVLLAEGSMVLTLRYPVDRGRLKIRSIQGRLLSGRRGAPVSFKMSIRPDTMIAEASFAADWTYGVPSM